MFIATFYPKLKLFYMDNVSASVTNSMSADQLKPVNSDIKNTGLSFGRDFKIVSLKRKETVVFKAYDDLSDNKNPTN